MMPYFLKISLIVLGFSTPSDGRSGRFSETFSMDVKSHQQVMSDIVSKLGLSLYRFEILWMLADASFDQLFEIFTPTIAKRKYMPVAGTLSQLLSITLGYLATGNAFGGLGFINATSPQSNWIIMLETCLLLRRQTITEWISRNTDYRQFNTLHNITTRAANNTLQSDSTILLTV